jgi:hypothetical protein
VFEDDPTAQKYGYKRANGITPGARVLLILTIGFPALIALVCLIALIALR